jgi:alkylation response protein AidB-like acyl-CoA dehydrogenase
VTDLDERPAPLAPAGTEGALDEFRREVSRLIESLPALFGAEAWEGAEQRPPARAALAALGAAGLLKAPILGARNLDPAVRWAALARSAALHEAFAGLPVGAAVLTHVEVGARLLADAGFTAAAHGAAHGEHLAALAVTEPGGGLDFDAMTTTLRAEGERLRLDGEKWCISNAPFADEILVLARDARLADDAPARHTLLRVPAGAPGVRVTALDTFGHRGLTGRIELAGVQVDADAVVGAPGSGLLRLMRHWVHERVMLAVRASASAERLLENCLPGLAAQDPGLAADLGSRVIRERVAVRHALHALASDSCDARTAAGCKLRSVAVLRDTAEAAYLFAPSAATERALRDALGLALAGGSDEALRMQIARAL